MNGETRSTRGRKGTWMAAGALVVLLGGACGVYWKMRGPSGATTTLGGAMEAKAAPELPADPDRWVNGAPVTLAAARGQVILIEGWHPA